MAGSKKKKNKAGSGWSWRLAGIALCAFFALGVLTGLSQSGRLLARRIEALFPRLPRSGRSELIPAAYHTFFFKEPTTEDFGPSSTAATVPGRTEPIALAEHPDGFYQIGSEGSLSGPVLPSVTGDLPILSGSGVENADASQLLQYASDLIRAEAILAAIISEMCVTADGEIRLYLDRPHVVVVLARRQFPLQLAQAARVLEMWRGHRERIGLIDMTIPSEAIVRPKAQTMERLDHIAATGPVSPARLNSLLSVMR